MKPFLTILVLVGFLCSNLPARPVVQNRMPRSIDQVVISLGMVESAQNSTRVC